VGYLKMTDDYDPEPILPLADTPCYTVIQFFVPHEDRRKTMDQAWSNIKRMKVECTRSPPPSGARKGRLGSDFQGVSGGFGLAKRVGF
jgi:hypothetical protein